MSHGNSLNQLIVGEEPLLKSFTENIHIDIELNPETKKLLEHFKKTGEYRSALPLRDENDSDVEDSHISPYEKDLVFSKIMETDEEHMARDSDRFNSTDDRIASNPYSFTHQEVFLTELESMSQNKNPLESSVTIHHSVSNSKNYLVVPEQQPDDSLMYSMNLSTQEEPDIDQLYYQEVSKDMICLSTAFKGSSMTRKTVASDETWRKFVLYEDFIKQVMFDMGIMDRLYDDFQTFLEIAQDNYRKMKQKKVAEEAQNYNTALQPEQKQTKESQPQILKHSFYVQTEDLLTKSISQSARLNRSRRNTNNDSQNCSYLQNCCQPQTTSATQERSFEKKNPESQTTDNKNDKNTLEAIKKSNLKKKNSISQKKKVTLVVEENTPEQLNQLKIALANALAHHIQILTEGKVFKKYCFNKSKIEMVHAFFSMDFKCFAWKALDKDESKLEPMNELIQVLQGRRSRNFKKYLKKGEQQEDGVSFSMVFKSRTVDLSAETPGERLEFLTAMKELKKFI